jgi:hypothetical protein
MLSAVIDTYWNKIGHSEKDDRSNGLQTEKVWTPSTPPSTAPPPLSLPPASPIYASWGEQPALAHAAAPPPLLQPPRIRPALRSSRRQTPGRGATPSSSSPAKLLRFVVVGFRLAFVGSVVPGGCHWWSSLATTTLSGCRAASAQARWVPHLVAPSSLAARSIPSASRYSRHVLLRQGECHPPRC